MELEDVYCNIEDHDNSRENRFQTEEQPTSHYNGVVTSQLEADSRQYSTVIKKDTKCSCIKRYKKMLKCSSLICFLVLLLVTGLGVLFVNTKITDIEENQQLLKLKGEENHQLLMTQHEENQQLLMSLAKDMTRNDDNNKDNINDKEHGNCTRTNDSSPLQMISGSSSHHLTILPSGITVLCDPVTDDGGWIIFQRRVTGDVNFYRGWSEYVEGFGNLTGEFWLGLDNLHTLCPPEANCELRVDMGYEGKPHNVKKTPNARYYAKYGQFSIGGQKDNYLLDVSMYSGNAGDSLLFHSGIGFSTFDVSNNKYPAVNCAVNHKGAWWYYHCSMSNLNGIWDLHDNSTSASWTHLTYCDSVSLSEMKVRPRD